MLPASHSEGERRYMVPTLNLMATNTLQFSMDKVAPPLSPPTSSQITSMNVVLEVQSRKRTLSVDHETDNHKRSCCRGGSESGFSSATEDTIDHPPSTPDKEDSSPEQGISYLFSPLVTSPYNYHRNYSFCDRTRKEIKPLDLTTESLASESKIDKKSCLNSVKKIIFTEPECLNKSLKHKETKANISDNTSFVPLNLQDSSLVPGVINQVKPCPALIPLNDFFEDGPELLPLNSQSVLKHMSPQAPLISVQNLVKISKSEQVGNSLLVDMDTKNISAFKTQSVELQPVILSSKEPEDTVHIISKSQITETPGVNSMPQLVINATQPTSTSPQLPKISVKATDNENISEADLASHCLQEFFKSWNDAPDLELVAFQNYEIASLPIVEIGEQGNQMCDVEHQDDKTGMKTPEESENENKSTESINMVTVLEYVPTETTCAMMDKPEENKDTPNFSKPLSMPLLGGEPDLSPIIQVEEKEQPTETTNEAVYQVVIETCESKNKENIKPEYNQVEQQVSSDEQPESQDNLESDSETGMLAKIMKPTLPQNCTLIYSRFFGSDEESFLSRPGVSPMSCIPVIDKFARSRTPTPQRPMRVQSRRRASLSSFSSTSPCTLSKPSSPYVNPSDEAKNTPVTRSMSRAATPVIAPVTLSSESSEDSTHHTGYVTPKRSWQLPEKNLLSTQSGSQNEELPQFPALQVIPNCAVRRGRSRSQSPAIQNIGATSGVNYQSPAVRSVTCRGRSQSPAIKGTHTSRGTRSQSPAVRGVKHRGRPPAFGSKIKKTMEMKLALEVNTEQLALQHERKNMLSHESWMEQRRLLYLQLLPEKPSTPPVSTNMQPCVVLERNPGLDARAISEAQLAKMKQPPKDNISSSENTKDPN